MANPISRGIFSSFGSSLQLPNQSHSMVSHPIKRPCKIRVVTRIRPMTDQEMGRKCQSSIHPILPQDIIDNLENTGMMRPNTPSPKPCLNPNFLNRFRKGRDRSSDGRSTQPASPSSRNWQNEANNNLDDSAHGSVHSSSYHTTRLIAGGNPIQRQFDYDTVLPPDTTQAEVYERAVGTGLGENLLKGYNATIFTYGQTGSGKTYTMGGRKEAEAMNKLQFSVEDQKVPNEYVISEDDGISQRAIHDLFQAAANYPSEVSITLTYMEIFKNELRDLLGEASRSSLKIREGENGVSVKGLRAIEVKSAAEANEILQRASKRRTRTSTTSRVISSQAHTICTLTVTTSPTSDDLLKNTLAAAQVFVAKLRLVDLAGSERAKSVSLSKLEISHVNKDMQTFERVVAALVNQGKKDSIESVGKVPHKESKLTRILRDSLGGNCRTFMIACVSPADECLDDSLNTLGCAEQARAITNFLEQNSTKPKSSKSEHTTLVVENKALRERVEELERKLLESKTSQTEACQADSFDSLSNFDPKVSKELSCLQEKLKKAEEEAKAALGRSRSVASVADKMKKYKTTQVTAPALLDSTLGEETKDDIQLQYSTSEEYSSAGGDEKKKAAKSDSLAGVAAHSDLGIDERMELNNVSQQISRGRIALVEIQAKTVAMMAELNQEEVRRDRLRIETKHLQNWINSEKSEKKDQEAKRPGLSSFTGLLRRRSATSSMPEEVEMSLMPMHAGGFPTTPDTRDAEIRGLQDKLQKVTLKKLEMEKKVEQTKLQVSAVQKILLDLQQRVPKMEAALKEERMQREESELLQKSTSKDYLATVGETENLRAENARLEDEIHELKEQLGKQKAHIEYLESKAITTAGVGNLMGQVPLGNSYSDETPSQDHLTTSLDSGARHALSKDGVAGSLECDTEVNDLEKTAENSCSVDNDIKDQIEQSDEENESDDPGSIISTVDENDSEGRLPPGGSDTEGQLAQVNDKENQVFHDTKDQVSDLEDQTAQISDTESQLSQVSDEKENHQLLVDTRIGGARRDDSPRPVLSVRNDENSILRPEPVEGVKLVIRQQFSHDSGDENATDVEGEGAGSTTEDAAQIRQHAARLLLWADKAIQKRRGDAQSTCSSLASSNATEMRPNAGVVRRELTVPRTVTTTPLPGRPPMIPPREETEQSQIVISNIEAMEKCTCQASLFSGNAEHVEFYLPKLGMACSCGKQQEEKAEPEETEDPCELTNILREWQAQFLLSQGLTGAVEFVHAFNQRGYDMAKDMRDWRREQKLPSIKTKSCKVALHIWSRTCKAVVRSVRAQQAQGMKARRPDFLQAPTDNRTISTLDCGSTLNKF